MFNYKRRESSETLVGKVALGAKNPIRIQSMTNTNTMNTEKSVQQAILIAEEGGELVRLTAQGTREAENLKEIHSLLREKGYDTPLVADIHFNPKAAEVAAQYVEKVRINPGNFANGGIEEIEKKLIPLLDICKKHQTAIRIGVNHGSLSSRILDKYGDTPQGMVVSAMEFLRLCRKHDFQNVVISMKSSNTMVMVQSVRLLVKEMNQEGMNFPLHLGVTEAGDGEDGRVKSAVGIGTLLADGIGDTIRVSLSEDPEKEIPVAKKLVEYISSRENHSMISGEETSSYSPFAYVRRKTKKVGLFGDNQIPVIIAPQKASYGDLEPDFVGLSDTRLSDISFVEVDSITCKEKLIDLSENTVIIVSPTNKNVVGDMKAVMHYLLNQRIEAPVVFHLKYKTEDLELFQVMLGADLGAMLLDGFGDGVMVECESSTITLEQVNAAIFGALQAARVRISKTEYISCPSCGRTLFDLQTTIAKIKERTSHLKGLKIGIMGCIVNGPGEMADADFGYIGAGVGKVSLYKAQECIEKNIPEEDAVDRLIQLIKDNGRWVEK